MSCVCNKLNDDSRSYIFRIRYLFCTKAEITGITEFKIPVALLLQLCITARLRQAFYSQTVIDQCRHISAKILEQENTA